MFNLTANGIGLITLAATVTGLFVAVVIYKRSLARNELSNVRLNVIQRLEHLPKNDELQDASLSEDERGAIYYMHIQIVERDVQKYLVTAKVPKDIDLKSPLNALMQFDIKDIITKRALFRQRCYQLLFRIDQAYYYEIETSSFWKKLEKYYYEISGAFMGIALIYMLKELFVFLYM